jgi:hypothetical protein
MLFEQECANNRRGIACQHLLLALVLFVLSKAPDVSLGRSLALSAMLLPCTTPDLFPSLHTYAPWVCNAGVARRLMRALATWRPHFVQSVVLDVMMDNEHWDSWAGKFLNK